MEAPSDRKGNEKGTTALPPGGRPTFFQSHSLPLTEITRDFPGKTGMEILLTSHLQRQNTSEHTLFPLVTHSQLLTFSEPIRICGLDSSEKKNYIMWFLLCKAFLFIGLNFTITLMLIYNLVGSPCFPSQTFSLFYSLGKITVSLCLPIKTSWNFVVFLV